MQNDSLLTAVSKYNLISEKTVDAMMRGKDVSPGEFNMVLNDLISGISEITWIEKMNEYTEDLYALHKTNGEPMFIPVPGTVNARRVPHPIETVHPGLGAAKHAPDEHARELAWVIDNGNSKLLLILTFDPHVYLLNKHNIERGRKSSSYWNTAAQKIGITMTHNDRAQCMLTTAHQWFDALQDKIEKYRAHPIDVWMDEAARAQGVDIFFVTSLRIFGWYKPPAGTSGSVAATAAKNELQEEFARRVSLHIPIYRGGQEKAYANLGRGNQELDYHRREDENLARRYWDELVLTADTEGASDIHLVPVNNAAGDNQCIASLRLHGKLIFFRRIPDRITQLFLKCAVEGSAIPINEVDVTRDGRRKWTNPETKKQIDMRISVTPSMGRSPQVVMRLLDSSRLKQGVNQLGLPPNQINIWKKACHATHGIVMISGPTNSGKSSTLYAVLQEIRRGDKERAICTVEDPVEYILPFRATQVQVDNSKGMTYPKIIRQFMRNDPDTILVGEVRDKETCDAALQLALTGHQVLSTIHANSAAETITRILELGVEPFIVAETLKMVAAQRLVGTPCPECMIASRNHPLANKLRPEQLFEVDDITRSGLPEQASELIREHMSRWQKENPTLPEKGVWVNSEPSNCLHCRGTGLYGRMALQEIATILPSDKELIKAGDIDAISAKQPLRDQWPLDVNAWAMAWEGKIPIQEAVRLTTMLTES